MPFQMVVHNGFPLQQLHKSVQCLIRGIILVQFLSIFSTFYRYDTFIERSCEQLNIARRQQMNVEITAKIKRLICCDGHYPSTTRRTTFNYIDWTYHFS